MVLSLPAEPRAPAKAPKSALSAEGCPLERPFAAACAFPALNV